MAKFGDAMLEDMPLRYLCIKLDGWNFQNELLLQKGVKVKVV